MIAAYDVSGFSGLDPIYVYDVCMAKEIATIRIDPGVLRQARLLAAERDWTLSKFLSRAVERVVQGELTRRGTVEGDGPSTSP